MKITFYITEKDIEEGVRGDCRRCPGARAILRRLAPGSIVEVTTALVAVSYGRNKGGNDYEYEYEITTPDRLSNFIRNFDKSTVVYPNPCRFTLDIPTEVLR